MNCVGTHADNGNAAGAGPLRLEVLLAYEDFETGLRARQTLDQIMQQLEPDADVQVNLWRFDLLRDTALREEAAREAAAADMVFVSAHGQDGPPATVNLWMQEWFGRKGSEPCALVVSLDADAKDAPGATQMVKTVGAAARRAGLDLFLHVGPAQGRLESEIANIQRRAGTKTLLLDEILQRAERPPLRDWGPK